MYQLYLDNKQVGTAMVIKEGLYYRFSCVCNLPMDCIYKVMVSDGSSVVKLGVFIPENDKFRLNSRIPIKKLLGDDLYFIIEKNNVIISKVGNNVEFAHLDRLENARLKTTDGQKYILIN